MEKDSWKKYCELCDRSCDALVLGYEPTNVLSGRFYVPGVSNCEEGFGFALRKVFGEKNGLFHWADSVKWATVKDLNRLEPRILRGVQEVVSGDPDYQTEFDQYFSSLGRRFEHHWVFLKGDLYKFIDGEREKAVELFDGFWNETEKNRWREIHGFMREYTANEFRGKDDKKNFN
jgi:hypothetical protein